MLTARELSLRGVKVKFVIAACLKQKIDANKIVKFQRVAVAV
jgi:hypothetical protein